MVVWEGLMTFFPPNSLGPSALRCQLRILRFSESRCVLVFTRRADRSIFSSEPSTTPP